MNARALVARINGATNQLYRRLAARPHYLEMYAQMVDDAVRDATDIVHLGCGPLWLGRVCRVSLEGKNVYAVDPDEVALARNPATHKVVAWGEDIPLPDASIDVVVLEHVVEHLEDPGAVMRECRRLLRSGGRVVFTTPNLLSYSGLATHLTPLWFHAAFIGLLRKGGGGRAEDPYPTHFRMNTLKQIRRLSAEVGLEVESLFTGVDWPSYTWPFPVVHQAAALWHLMLDRVDALEPFRITITATLRKP